MSYLDFDKFFNSINNNKVLVALLGLAHNNFITGLEPPPIGVVDKGLGIGLFVVEVSDDGGWGLNEELSARLVFCDLFTIGVDDFGFESCDEGAGGTDEDVEFASAGDEWGGFGHTWKLCKRLS